MDGARRPNNCLAHDGPSIYKNPHPLAPKRPKFGRISLGDPRTGRFCDALQFLEHPGAILACVSLWYQHDRLEKFVLRALSNRRAKHTTLQNHSRLVSEFILFAKSDGRPFAGPSAVVTSVERLDLARLRGDSAPQQGLRALTVLDEALELGWGLKHPSIRLAKRDNPRRARRQAPTVSLEFTLSVEKLAAEGTQTTGCVCLARVSSYGDCVAKVRRSDRNRVDVQI